MPFSGASPPGLLPPGFSAFQPCLLIIPLSFWKFISPTWTLFALPLSRSLSGVNLKYLNVSRAFLHGITLHDCDCILSGSRMAGQVPAPLSPTRIVFFRLLDPPSQAFEQSVHAVQSVNSQSLSQDSKLQLFASVVSSQGTPPWAGSTSLSLARS